MDNYRYKIDKKALTEFFTSETPSKESLKAAHMVITAVIIKHFSKYISLDEDLHSLCIVALLEIRSRYDLSYSAYNYAYTKCRNEIGNYLAKRRELIVEDILPVSNASVTPEVASLPGEINKFKQYLTGEKSFTILDLTEREAINIVVFCEVHNPSRKVTPPDYILNSPNAIPILYRLLLKI